MFPPNARLLCYLGLVLLAVSGARAANHCDLPLIADGRMTVSGIQGTYTCDYGHQLNPADRTTNICLQSTPQRWNDPHPTCEPVTCPQVTITNSPGSPFSSGNYEDTKTVTCEDGYDAVPGSQIRCSGNGQWQPSVTCEETAERCPEVNLSLLQVDMDKTYDTSRREGSALHLKCIPNYRMVNPSRSRIDCNKVGSTLQWTALPQCEERLCDLPTATPDLILGNTVNGRKIGGVLEFSCPQYFDMIGEASAECMDDQTWSNSVPTCKERKCEVPEVDLPLLVGNADKGSKIHGHITFSCLIGTLEGLKEAQCTEAMTWEPADIPHCNVVEWWLMLIAALLAANALLLTLLVLLHCCCATTSVDYVWGRCVEEGKGGADRPQIYTSWCEKVLLFACVLLLSLLVAPGYVAFLLFRRFVGLCGCNESLPGKLGAGLLSVVCTIALSPVILFGCCAIAVLAVHHHLLAKELEKKKKAQSSPSQSGSNEKTLYPLLQKGNNATAPENKDPNVVHSNDKVPGSRAEYV